MTKYQQGFPVNSFEQCNTYFDGSKECFYDVPYQFIQQNVGKFLLTI